MGTKLVTNRDITVSSTSGNSINFEKGKPVHVPDHFVEDCMAAGAIPAEGEKLNLKEIPTAKEAPTGDNRKQLILDGIDTMVMLNERGSFSANGFPKQPLLEKKVGFVIDTRELEILWRAYDVARRQGIDVELPGTTADKAPVVESTDESEGAAAESEETGDEQEKVEPEAEAEEDSDAATTEATEGTAESGGADGADKPAPTVSKKKTAKKKTAKKS